jgi:hypothetical protein
MRTEIVHVRDLQPGDRLLDWGGDTVTVSRVESFVEGWLVYATDGLPPELIDPATMDPHVERITEDCPCSRS